MLSVHEETAEVRITHTSVKDLLTEKSSLLWADVGLHRFHVNAEDVDGEITALCIRCLEIGCLNEGSVPVNDPQRYSQRIGQFPFLPYACMFWPQHLRSASRPFIDLSSRFPVKKSSIRKNWWLSYYPSTTGQDSLLAPRDFTLLHMAAYLNIPYLAHQLEQTGELFPRLNSKDSHGASPLFWAAEMGNMEMFVFLLQRGAVQEGVGGESVFELACRRGQGEIAEYLLNMGHDVNARAVEIGAMQGLGVGARWWVYQEAV
jgi:hypothetical protein